jgi:hypothetical protein
MLKLLILMLLTMTQLTLLQGCAGYRYQEKNNPFAQYGVKSLRVPLFYNHSNLANTSSVFTREIYDLLSEFKGLSVQGSKGKADATLIGIVESSQRLNETITNRGLRVAKSVASSNIGNSRGDFYVPSASNVQLILRIIVIKNPSENEIKLLRSEFGKNVPVSSKVIFNEQIRVSASYNREYFDGDAGAVHATLNRGAVHNSLDAMAKNAASAFRDMILYAF